LVGPDPGRRRLFTHVYLEAFHRGYWIPLDATMPHPMGWAPRAPVKNVIAIERRPRMLSQDPELQGAAALTGTAWVSSLVQAVHRGGLRPRDERVRNLWNLLRQRGRLRLWTRALLLYMWRNGLRPAPRRYTATLLASRLRIWGILPRLPGRRAATRLRRARALRPVAMRPVARVAARR
jgi:hypothetical protein